MILRERDLGTDMPQEQEEICTALDESLVSWTVRHRALTTPTARCRSRRVRFGDPLERRRRNQCLLDEVGNSCLAPVRTKLRLDRLRERA